MYLCLMHHGKAEPYSMDKEDGLRHLTEKGRSDVMTMASLAAQWWPMGTLRLWTSPSVRTCETAEIMGHQLHPTTVQTWEAIEKGDFMPLHEEILSDALAQSVLIVGHSPFLEDWTKKITGASFDYKTGALLCIDYDPYDGTYGKGKILLLFHPQGAQMLFRK